MSLQVLRQTIARLALRDRADRPISSQGGALEWLIDLRPVFLRRDALAMLADLFWARMETAGPFQLAAVETAGVPLLAAILLRAPQSRGEVNAVIVRKDRKTTGMGNLVEGVLTEEPFVLVDDILNSGASAEKACVALEALGRRVARVFVVIDYASTRGLAWRRRRGVEVESLFALEEFGLKLHVNPPPPPQRYRLLWRTDVPGGYPFYVVPKSAPLLVGETIYRGCDAGKMHAFDARTGAIRWEHVATGASPQKGVWSSPAVHDGRLYYGAYNGVLYALDAATGQEIWTQPCCEWIGSSPLLVPEHGLLFIGLEYARPWAQGGFAAFDMMSGAKVWEQPLQRFQHGSAAYWRGGDLVICGSSDHEVVAVRPRTGEAVWKFPTRRSVKYAPALDEANGLAAFASFDKSIYLVDAATGAKLGEWETGDICYTTPLFANGRIFCGSGDKHLYVIDVASRTLVAKLYFGARIYASPILVDGRVVFGANDGRVTEMDAQTLEVVGQFQLSDAVCNAVVVDTKRSRIICSSSMNELCALEWNSVI